MLTWGLCSLLKGSAFPCEALAGALTINRTLTKIDLADNFIGDKGCKALVVLSAHLASLLLEPGPAFLREALADALKSNQTVACINLRNNNIEDEGCKAHGSHIAASCNPAFLCEAIADILTINCAVTHINLSLNKIGDEGSKALQCSRVVWSLSPALLFPARPSRRL